MKTAEDAEDFEFLDEADSSLILAATSVAANGSE
jgi:hypothetical protein